MARTSWDFATMILALGVSIRISANGLNSFPYVRRGKILLMAQEGAANWQRVATAEGKSGA